MEKRLGRLKKRLDVAAALVALDFEGDPRLNGPKPDLGADETRFIF